MNSVLLNLETGFELLVPSLYSPHAGLEVYTTRLVVCTVVHKREVLMGALSFLSFLIIYLSFFVLVCDDHSVHFNFYLFASCL